MIKLSLRLQTIANMIKPCKHLIDVGCDHGYLSIYLYLNNIVKNILNIDVNKEPLESALKNIIAYNAQNNIKCYLNNGLKNLKLDYQPDYITISGMGGFLISEIIENSNVFPKRFIVQPNNNISKLRQWFFKNNFKIIDEKVIYDNKIGYVVIEVEKQDQKINYKLEDIYLGPILKDKINDENVKLYYQEKFNKLMKIPNEFINDQKKEQLKIIKGFLNV